jgi:hypothetical protein
MSRSLFSPFQVSFITPTIQARTLIVLLAQTRITLTLRKLTLAIADNLRHHRYVGLIFQ